MTSVRRVVFLARSLHFLLVILGNTSCHLASQSSLVDLSLQLLNDFKDPF